MKMFVAYLFICAVITATAANPVLQRLPIQSLIAQKTPTQNCPIQACPAKACPAQNCPAKTCPTQNCPQLQIRGAKFIPAQNFGPSCPICQKNNARLANVPIMANQPNKICPCNQPLTVQNSVPLPMQQTQPASCNQPIEKALNQLLLAKLLSPQQTPDTNTRSANENGVNKQSSSSVPNVINNYIILPPEYFKFNETNPMKIEDIINGKRKGRGNRRRRKNHRKNYNSNDGNDQARVSETICQEDNDNRLKPSRRESCKNGGRSVTYNIDKTKSNGSIMDIYDLKSVGNQKNDNCKDMNSRQKKIRNKLLAKSFEDAIVKDFCKKYPSVPEEVARNLFLYLRRKIQNEEPNISLPVNKKSSVPVILPERQLQHTPLLNKEALQRRRNSHRSENRKQHKKNNQDTKCETSQKIVELNPTIIDVDTKKVSVNSVVTTDKIITTTEKQVIELEAHEYSNSEINKKTETQMEIPNEPLVKDMVMIKEKFSKLNEIETTTPYLKPEKYPELGKEDKVPTIYENGISEDYYPDFRGDGVPIFTSQEDTHVEKNDVDRYHYTTDRNSEISLNKGSNGQEQDNFKTTDSIKETVKEKSGSDSCENENKSSEEKESEYTLPNPLEESEESDESYNQEKDTDESDEVQFFSPPHLELPDFETKQIFKTIREEDIEDNFQIKESDDIMEDSDSKSSEIEMVAPNEIRRVKVFSKDKQGKVNIETVFANSKVAKYGQSDDYEEASSSPVITYYLPDDAITEERIQLPDNDDSTIVVAKSIKDLKDIF